MFTQANLIDDLNHAKFAIKIEVSGPVNDPTTVIASLLTPSGETISTVETAVTKEGRAESTIDITKPRLWTAET
ncbi:MAG: hypothetical protein LC725_01825, partial [Lentisphaerae bacterium]|nr:hypothetical protein [Lentisphaerota bacterium]